MRSPLDHVFQWIYQKIPVGTSDNWFTPDGHITLVSNHIIMQIIAALVLILLIPRFVRVRDTGVYAIVLESNNQEQMLFKHAIATVAASRPASSASSAAKDAEA